MRLMKNKLYCNKLFNLIMKKLLLLIGFVTQLNFSQNIEYKIITTVESILPNGLGRSRMITTDVSQDTSSFTSDRGEGEKNRRRSREKAR